ncbi:hypothetical protein JNM05_13365 [bacterium]|nr:hypothetical protein [bacterium]
MNFKTGFNLIAMGPAQGKSTLTESLRTALSISELNPPDYFREGTSDSAVRLVAVINHKEYSIRKEWTGQRVNHHTVRSEDGKLAFDLTDSAQVMRWLLHFLKLADKMFDESMETMPVNLLSQRYHTICGIMFPDNHDESASHSIRLHTLLNIHLYDHINLELNNIRQIASDSLNEFKMKRQAAIIDRKIVERFEEDLRQTDNQIKQLLAVIDQVSASIQADEADLRQADKIYEFIVAKKHEIEKIDFELRSYNSILKNDIGHEFTDDEIREIEKKKKMYEQISLREESLHKKIVERGHLERNLNGILKEISQYQISQTASDTGVGKTKLDAYTSEVNRIRETLKSYSSLDQDMEAAKRDKNLYQSSHDKHLVIGKLKQFVSQNEQKKVKSLIEKLEQDRDIIVKELEQMQSTVHEDRYRDLFSKVQQFRQQIVELQKRIELLYDKRLETLRNFEENLSAEPDLMAMESKFRRQVHLKKYLSVITEVAQFLQEDLRASRRAEFRQHILRHGPILPDFFVQLVEYVLQFQDKSFLQAQFKRYSHSQIAEFNLIFRLLCIDYATHHSEAVLDEHYRWLLDPVQMSRIDTVLQHLNFGQCIAFDKA